MNIKKVIGIGLVSVIAAAGLMLFAFRQGMVAAYELHEEWQIKAVETEDVVLEHMTDIMTKALSEELYDITPARAEDFRTSVKNLLQGTASFGQTRTWMREELYFEPTAKQTFQYWNHVFSQYELDMDVMIMVLDRYFPRK